jgi:RNA polymerase sigma-70 factor (ECF subfamily)
VLASHDVTDDTLVAATLAGDEDAFGKLFERHRRLVARIAGRFFSQVEQIEEIIQDSFTKAYFALSTYHGTHAASFKAWLGQITVNSCYDQLRRTQRRPPQSFIDITDSENHELGTQLRAAGASADVERAAISRDLAAKLLSRLSPEDRLVLTLLDVEGFSVAEIAEMTGWSISKVKVRAHRARAHLRRILQKYI